MRMLHSRLLLRKGLAAQRAHHQRSSQRARDCRCRASPASSRKRTASRCDKRGKKSKRNQAVHVNSQIFTLSNQRLIHSHGLPMEWEHLYSAPTPPKPFAYDQAREPASRAAAVAVARADACCAPVSTPSTEPNARPASDPRPRPPIPATIV